MVRVAQKNSGSSSAKFGITKFSDMSTEEFKSTILMKKKSSPRDPNSNEPVPKSVVDVPAYLDWREKGAGTAVKNQEQCGSCWAFSVTENVESMWIIAGKANDSIAFAPQQIVDCDTSDEGCDGGDPTTAYDYIINAGGIESESAYPYTGEDGTCGFISKDVVGKITSWQYATELLDEETLQANLIAWGPLSVCVDASAWQDYESGVMTYLECAYIPLLDHCVQLVGYNATNSDNNYWIVRNSWGTDWGIEGYIWLTMWEDTCGISQEATSSVV